MVALWRIRGPKRVWLYDAHDKRHLLDEVLERVVLRETEEDIPYDPAWDGDARAIDLEPGWALSWPQNAPHRVDNIDGLNVSITTDYFIPAATRKYGVYFANGMLRRRFGLRPASTRSSGPGAGQVRDGTRDEETRDAPPERAPDDGGVPARRRRAGCADRRAGRSATSDRADLTSLR